jgi:hypothetical protein
VFSRLEWYNAKKAEELELKRRANGEMQSGVPVPPNPTQTIKALLVRPTLTSVKSVMSRGGIEPPTY